MTARWLAVLRRIPRGIASAWAVAAEVSRTRHLMPEGRRMPVEVKRCQIGLPEVFEARSRVGRQIVSSHQSADTCCTVDWGVCLRPRSEHTREVPPLSRHRSPPLRPHHLPLSAKASPRPQSRRPSGSAPSTPLQTLPVLGSLLCVVLPCLSCPEEKVTYGPTHAQIVSSIPAAGTGCGGRDAARRWREWPGS